MQLCVCGSMHAWGLGHRKQRSSMPSLVSLDGSVRISLLLELTALLITSVVRSLPL